VASPLRHQEGAARIARFGRHTHASLRSHRPSGVRSIVPPYSPVRIVGVEPHLPGTSGPTLKEGIESVDAECGEDRPAFCGINCSHPLEFLPAIEPGDWFERVRCLRPNAAMMDKTLCARSGTSNPGTLSTSAGAWVQSPSSIPTSTSGADAAAPGNHTSTKLLAISRCTEGCS